MGKILIAVDLQNDFTDGALGTEQAQGIVSKCAEKISNFSGDIYVTLDTHTEDYLSTQEGELLPVRHCISGSVGHELNPIIKNALFGKNYTVIEKPTFGSVELAGEIAEKEVDEIELIGLCTDICVVSNALILKAFMPEVKISVDASCCAGVTRQAHKSALDTMRSCQIIITGEE